MDITDAGGLFGARPAPREPEKSEILTVSQLAGRMKTALESEVGEVWVEGEVSDFKHHQPSGHWYFSLKDAASTVRAVMYVRENRALRFKVESGMKVLAQARATFYGRSGSAQITVTTMKPAGMGELALAFEQLKARLGAEGLFDPARKRPLPFLPRAVGVVTSPVGAAIRDIIKVILGRFPNMTIILCPVKVQGEGSAAEIAGGIELFNRAGLVDVLIVGRGGGSMEDLWAFNEEVVARAIAASKIPVVSAVGHEVDTTIADFVADVRAATPSHAGETVVPVRAELESRLLGLEGRLRTALARWAERGRRRLADLMSRPVVRRPLDRVHELAQALDEETERMHVAARRAVSDRAMRLVVLVGEPAGARLAVAARRQVEQRAARLATLAGRMEALGPLKTLMRGFSIATRAGTRSPIWDARQLHKGELIDIMLGRGSATCKVQTVYPEGRPSVQPQLPFDDPPGKDEDHDA